MLDHVNNAIATRSSCIWIFHSTESYWQQLSLILEEDFPPKIANLRKICSPTFGVAIFKTFVTVNSGLQCFQTFFIPGSLSPFHILSFSVNALVLFDSFKKKMVLSLFQSHFTFFFLQMTLLLKLLFLELTFRAF